MKNRIILLAAGAALVLAFWPGALRAQNTENPPPTGQPPTNAPPARRSMMPPRPGHQPPQMVYRRTMIELQMAKRELEHSEDDLGGHKQTALEACDKAMQELEAVLKAMPPGPSPMRGMPPPGGTPPGMAAPQQANPPPSSSPPPGGAPPPAGQP